MEEGENRSDGSVREEKKKELVVYLDTIVESVTRLMEKEGQDETAE